MVVWWFDEGKVKFFIFKGKFNSFFNSFKGVECGIKCVWRNVSVWIKVVKRFF